MSEDNSSEDRFQLIKAHVIASAESLDDESDRRLLHHVLIQLDRDERSLPLMTSALAAVLLKEVRRRGRERDERRDRLIAGALSGFCQRYSAPGAVSAALSVVDELRKSGVPV